MKNRQQIEQAVQTAAENVCKFKEDEDYIGGALKQQQTGFEARLRQIKSGVEALASAYRKLEPSITRFQSGEYNDRADGKIEAVEVLRFGAECLATGEKISQDYQQYLIEGLGVMQHELGRVNGRRLCDKPFQNELSSRLSALAEADASSLVMMFFTGLIFYPIWQSRKKNKLFREMAAYSGLSAIAAYGLPQKAEHYENCDFRNCCRSISEAVGKERELDGKYQTWNNKNTEYGKQLDHAHKELWAAINGYLQAFPEQYRNEAALKSLADALESGTAGTLNEAYRLTEGQ